MPEGYKVLMIFTDTNEKITGTLIYNRDDFIWVKANYEMQSIKNKSVEIVIYDEVQGNIHNNGFVAIVLGKLIWIRKKKPVSLNQKRSSKRIKINSISKIKKLNMSSGKHISILSPIHMRIINISANGVLVFSESDYPEDTTFFINIAILNKEMKEVPARIVRREEKPDGYYYGCILETTEDQKQTIRNFIEKKEAAFKKRIQSASQKTTSGSYINYIT